MAFTYLASASDHAGWCLQENLIQTMRSRNWTCCVLSHQDQEAVDYPLCVPFVVDHVKKGAVGILICGSGLGMSMVANRFSRMRAALCHSPEMASLARQHNDANILVLGARFISLDTALLCIERFLSTPFEGGRHQRRLGQMDEMEREMDSREGV